MSFEFDTDTALNKLETFTEEKVGFDLKIEQLGKKFKEMAIIEESLHSKF